VSAKPTNKRGRIAGLILGEVGEQEFEQRYQAAMHGQQFEFEDQRASANETDFLVIDGLKRPAFRINIKTHGTFLREAEDLVGLKPEDTFALATYKIKDANRRASEESLPFLFAIVSSEALATGAIADALPADVAFLLDGLGRYTGIKGIRALENLIVADMLDPAGHGSSSLVANLRAAVAAAAWRVISANKAEHLMNERMWERVPALARRNFSGNRDSQPNMHFSLSEDMIDLDELLALLREFGIQHIATKSAYHQI